MNTVGKLDRLGDSIRCVVSVSMLTEGWDANTVTHVLGVRASGTQPLCEQAIGRALRRQSYDLNEKGRFNVEYADVLGIPFDFTAKPVVAPPQPPRETIQVKAVRPERDALEIRFPQVSGYRVELPEDRLSLSTSHYSQVTVHGVDVFHPQTGEVRSDGPEGIACWFLDIDYNEESFFVRHAYFLGANDPYKVLLKDSLLGQRSTKTLGPRYTATPRAYSRNPSQVASPSR